MPLPVRAAVVTLATAGAALAPFSTPALAREHTKTIIVEGPSNVYDAAYSGVRTSIVVTEGKNRTDIRLRVSGLPAAAAGKTFGAHVHRKKCGPQAADSGPHAQNPKARPGAPLREKEIWLDIKAGKKGEAESRATARWRAAKGAAGSIVIHAAPTNAKTGDAGARLVCTTVPF
ncbi:superoxide dismutase family protein [Actinomadura rubrisoli]|uniref:Superoxide dismutase family protein n=1 Tax=Actinomadura rubrisoli TaxID=2530368 RepID=A0A4R5AR10_9ACTN|nr:superoxide dismutase family protein [Actinomadura rubrisoli]TDD75351.1 superoxide dismutase family protein [Actinomadura rubrisoli]